MNCDGEGPHSRKDETRMLPIGGGNAILCHHCYFREMAFRHYQNKHVQGITPYDIPPWQSLKIYPSTEEKMLQHQQHAVKLVEKAMEK